MYLKVKLLSPNSLVLYGNQIILLQHTIKPLYSDTLYKNNLFLVIKNFDPNLDQLYVRLNSTL